MLQTLLNNLTALRSFFSQAFFLSAFIPTLVFAFLNGLLLYEWSDWFHQWVTTHLPNTLTLSFSHTFAFTALFFAIWILSYATAAATQYWTRILEGKNWPPFLRDDGIRCQVKRHNRLQTDRDKASKIRNDLRAKQNDWDKQMTLARSKTTLADEFDKQCTQLRDNSAFPSRLHEQLKAIQRSGHLARDEAHRQEEKAPERENRAQQRSSRPYLKKLNHIKKKSLAGKRIEAEELQELIDGMAENAARMESLDKDITDLREYAENHASREVQRQEDELVAEFSVNEDYQPTRFGNIGLLAKTYIKKVYGCDLALVWNTLSELLEKPKTGSDKAASDNANSEKLQAHQTHLDFLVANLCFFSVLIFSWTLVFSLSGHPIVAVLFFLIGSGICSNVWYTAAVEQYRMLQQFTISLFSGPIRFQLLQELRAPLPADVEEERGIWKSFNKAFRVTSAVKDEAGSNFRYKHPPPPPS